MQIALICPRTGSLIVFTSVLLRLIWIDSSLEVLFGLTLVWLTCSMNYLHSLFMVDELENLYVYKLYVVNDPCLSVPAGRTWGPVGWWNTLTPWRRSLSCWPWPLTTSQTRTSSTVPPTHTVRSTPLYDPRSVCLHYSFPWSQPGNSQSCWPSVTLLHIEFVKQLKFCHNKT